VRAQLVGAWLTVALVAQVGAHVALVIGLARRKPRWRALAAVALPPLAPIWGWSEMPRSARVWALAFAAYAIAIAASQ
jgi:hypothetical protein